MNKFHNTVCEVDNIHEQRIRRQIIKLRYLAHSVMFLVTVNSNLSNSRWCAMEWTITFEQIYRITNLTEHLYMRKVCVRKISQMRGRIIDQTSVFFLTESMRKVYFVVFWQVVILRSKENERNLLQIIYSGQNVNQVFYKDVLECLRKRVIRMTPDIVDKWMLYHDKVWQVTLTYLSQNFWPPWSLIWFPNAIIHVYSATGILPLRDKCPQTTTFPDLRNYPKDHAGWGLPALLSKVGATSSSACSYPGELFWRW